MRIAVDTNILACAEGVNDTIRQDDALRLLGRLPYVTTVIPVQVLGELYKVLVSKGGHTGGSACDLVTTWRHAFTGWETSPEVMLAAAGLAAGHGLRIWDAVILAAASESACRILLSEDIHHDFTWGGVTVVNPFASEIHPLLSGLIERDPSV